MDHSVVFSIETFLATIPIIGSFFSFIVCLGYLLRPGKKRNILPGLLYGFLALPQLNMALDITGVNRFNLKIGLFLLPFYIFIGPLIHIYIRQILNRNFEWGKKQFLHLLPFFLILIPIFVISMEPAIANSRFQYLDYLFLFIFLYTISFLLLTGTELFPIFFNTSFPYPKIYIFTLILICFGFLDIFFFVWFQIEKSMLTMALSYSTLLLISVFIFWGSQIFPEYLSSMQEEIKKSKYVKSRLTGIDTEKTINEIHRLMIEESFYADEDLTLARLAEHLNLHPHQLSELFNQNLKVSFKAYINEKRIQSACRLLLEEPNRSIVSILYAVGFSSKSAFHAEFFKYKNTTPSLYRKSNVGS
ncbi:helix-turn-helix domain-containing protein [Leptospira ognonensis]|uniref:Helix-turn-helix domain-containing protein n=1 Tax=Leptospira ognonensis TaxID=2484945 RepID=A0A4R9K9C1_9LEPT|nr:AraC family transcriptional regulator [Leptospira ognonensis]TGL62317.1 helix-turn-helix domain-containing protein [Leptospira ognonensis]